MNSIWYKEAVQHQWKESIILLICKKGDKSDSSNCRGLSVLQTTYKILSNILLSRLSLYVEENIGHHQCGSQYNSSAADLILCIFQILEEKCFTCETS
jgi:hypothetical protein